MVRLPLSETSLLSEGWVKIAFSKTPISKEQNSDTPEKP